MLVGCTKYSERKERQIIERYREQIRIDKLNEDNSSCYQFVNERTFCLQLHISQMVGIMYLDIGFHTKNLELNVEFEKNK